MTNYVAFCLYGVDPKYSIGAIRNAEIALELLPGWTSVFFLGESVPLSVESQLSKLGSRVIRIFEPEDSAAMLWRYRAIFLEDSDLVIFRDTDSRLSSREIKLVEEWMSSGRDLHIIRDHPNHKSAILGGMWGAKSERLRSRFHFHDEIGGLITLSYGLDQEVIRLRVFRDWRLTRLVHDGIFTRECGSKKPEPHNSEGSFIGEVFSADEEPDPTGRQQLVAFHNSRSIRFWTQIASIRQIAADLALDLKRMYILLRKSYSSGASSSRKEI